MSARLRTGVLGILAVLLCALVTGTLPGIEAGPGAAPARAADGGGYQRTRTLERTFADADGSTRVVDSRTVGVRVSTTTDLRSRERVRVSWTGARPSGGRAANPYGESGMAQEFPVVVMQCRGVDDPSLPAAQQLRRETCWTSTRAQRSQSLPDAAAVWRHDLHASEAQRGAEAGALPFPAASVCPRAEGFSSWVTPFRAADGKEHVSCTAETMAPEAAVGAAFPAAEVAAFTDRDGRGSVDFEVRSEVENASLGCSQTVRCSLVVIPVMGLSCDTDRECRRGGRWLEGSANYASEGVDLAVSPALWWAESNWRNRFAVPLTFGAAPNVCDVLDERSPVGFYGSELVAQAAMQWAPSYCLSKSRFKFQHNQMADRAGFTLMENGGGAAAFVSSAQEVRGDDPVAYAPVAVTGFAVSYVVDRPDNAGPVDDLRLNARLLAKLLTQSYPGSDLGRGHPGMADNPLSLNQDPEFIALNPQLDRIAREAAATVLSLSEASDVMTALTSYIHADPDARAFLAGRPDRWGMRINPSYRAVRLPVDEWPLLDTYVPESSLECHQQNPTVYLNQVAAPVTSLRQIAEAVLDAWPNVQTRCDRSSPSDPWKIGRIDRQGLGTRFMLGIVSLGDAQRLGLRSARLRTTADSWVAPTSASLASAVALARPQTRAKGLAEARVAPYAVDPASARRRAGAYPGTMVVHVAARTRGMARDDARHVAQFIEIATSEGQRQGRGNGELPDGYLPIRATGVTAPLHASARRAAALIAAQTPVAGDDDGEAPDDETGDDDAEGTDAGPPDAGAGDLPLGPGVDDAPSQESPQEAADAKPDAPADAAALAAVPTAAVRAPLGGSALLPVLLALVLAGGLTAAGGRVAIWARRR